MSKCRLFLFVFLIFFLGIGLSPYSQAYGAGNELLNGTVVFDANLNTAADLKPTEIAVRSVGVNFDVLEQDQIEITPFPGVTYSVIKDHVDHRMEGQYSWFGTIEGMTVGHAILVVDGDTVTGSIQTDDAYYSISPIKGGGHTVAEIDQSMFPPDGCDGLEEHHPAPMTYDATADSGSTIEVMVVYTPASASEVGNITSHIQLAVDMTNTSYSNSGITPRMHLAHSAQVNYTETNNFSTDLTRLVGTSDGYMDNVHSLRDTYKADVVVLMVKKNATLCGLAAGIRVAENNAFCVVSQSCATDYYSFGHEIGHLQGARHDTFVDDSTTPFAYGHGFINGPDRWRTVMAYNDFCTQTYGKNCTRVGYWSNPNVNYQGTATGTVALEDNHRVLNETAYEVANFRQSTAGSCTYSITPTSRSFDISGGSGTVSVTASGSTCTWSAVSNSSWITITSGSSGTGSGQVAYTVSANSGATRSGSITLAGYTHTVTQTGTAGGGVTMSNRDYYIDGGCITESATVTNNSGSTASGYTLGLYAINTNHSCSGTLNGYRLLGVSLNSIANGGSINVDETATAENEVSGTYYITLLLVGSTGYVDCYNFGAASLNTIGGSCGGGSSGGSSGGGSGGGCFLDLIKQAPAK